MKHHKSIKVEHQLKPETLQKESKERPPAIRLEPAITLPQNTSVSLLQNKNRTVLLGVFSHACELEARRRTRIRNTWAAKLPDQVRMIFVLCEDHGNIDNSTTTNLANEKNIFNDILFMPCMENMDHGKTFTFMSTAHVMLSREAEDSNSFVDYIMKIDGDSILGVNALLKFLRLDKVPSDKPAIFGCQYLWSLDDWRKFKAPANMDYGHYMNGGGYGFSRVALDFIATSSYVRNHTIGYEDKMSGLWMMKLGRKAKWYNMCAHPTAFIDSTWIKDSGRFGEPLTTEVAIVHHVKEELIWNSVHKEVKRFEALNKGGDYTGEMQYDCSYLSGAIDLKFNSKRRWCEMPLKT
ncbi:hypothetical protein SARC_08728 [Sphaeroforma arctica JP610]|uniref:Hexosyltransferase n=1 Tax=Sphaeroforma arctica JP610 TaxID=667725 RepID=A0A0L0FQ65_9EUKA|nr:hypothetical protein SARC_08728 [Sphaeroforma arctica JP610]KNC78854.1 hypothetical protein SARC_08728 [Sphaeroforma arctica JP610]|eukprot:XP_014152756.1 hypothetical protein SARC_08728 [Sphaeroforma arctica JP610]